MQRLYLGYIYFTTAGSESVLSKAYCENVLHVGLKKKKKSCNLTFQHYRFPITRTIKSKVRGKVKRLNRSNIKI